MAINKNRRSEISRVPEQKGEQLFLTPSAKTILEFSAKINDILAPIETIDPSYASIENTASLNAVKRKLTSGGYPTDTD